MAESDYRRARTFEQRNLRSCTTDVVDLAWGTAFLNTDLSSVFDINHVLVTGPTVPPTRSLIEAADEILGGAGMRHRKFLIEEEALNEGTRVELVSRGFRHGVGVVMAKQRPFDRTVDTSVVEEVGLNRFLSLQERYVRAEPWATSERVVEAMLGVVRLLAAAGARFLAVGVAGSLAAGAHLYSDGETAQIEEVFTLEGYRGRGLARQVVTHVTRLAEEEGHGLVFLTADADDWPRKLYAKLGFDPIGRYHDFTLWPEDRAG